MRLGILHPGEMGVSVAASLVASGHDVGWVAAGRSAQTRERAARLTSYASLDEMLQLADGVFCVCPPDAALQQAQLVMRCGFEGVYVDANAVSPGTAQAMADLVGSSYVDGGIIGPPAVQPGTTRLYLSGPQADVAAGWFTGGALQVVVLEAGPVCAASALKMAYAAQTKGASALLLAVNALARQLGVEDALHAEWEMSQPGLLKRSSAVAAGVSAKAWRFEGEMLEIARTFDEANLPNGFHMAAAQLYAGLSAFKGLPPQELQMVVQALCQAASRSVGAEE